MVKCRKQTTASPKLGWRSADGFLWKIFSDGESIRDCRTFRILIVELLLVAMPPLICSHPTFAGVAVAIRYRGCSGYERSDRARGLTGIRAGGAASVSSGSSRSD